MKRMISLFLTVMLLIGSICGAKAMEATRWVCSQCGRTNEASYAFCPSCGAQRDAVCAACGYVFSQDELDFAFCPSCGTQRKASNSQTSQAAPIDTTEQTQEDCLITRNDDSYVFYFCNLSWDSILDMVVAITENATGMHTYLNGSDIYDGLSCYPEKEAQLFPGLTDDCYLPLASIYPQTDGTWWIEFQISPKEISFESPVAAAEWFSRVWKKLEQVLALSKPSSVEIDYPSGYTGERIASSSATPDEYIYTWTKSVSEGADNLRLYIEYGNLTLSLEHMALDDGGEFISCWIMLEQPDPGDAKLTETKLPDTIDVSDAKTDASKGTVLKRGMEPRGYLLSRYYQNAVKNFTHIAKEWEYAPYLTIITRLRDGTEQSSCLAVAVYDLSEKSLVIWGDAGLFSEGCEYKWQCCGSSYPVVVSSSKTDTGLIAFTLEENDALQAVVDKFEFKIHYAASPYFGFDEDEGKLKLVYFGVDDTKERLIAKTKWTKVVGFEDHTTYQTISLANYEGYADEYYEYKKEIEEGSTLWYGDICGVLINEDGTICGIHVADIGMVSLRSLTEENFYGAAKSMPRNVPDLQEVFDVSLLRTEDLGEITGSVYELPEGYKSSQAIYEEYIAALMDEGIPFWFDMLDEKDYVVALDAYELEEENINAVLFAIKDECLVLLERSDPDAESSPWQDRSPWDLLESMGWDLETYRYSTVWSLE